jgi:hypothetical protein
MYGIVLIAALAQQAKVDVQTVAPNEQDMAYTISPRGVHLGAITQKGTRWVILHDGVPGPAFDQIINDGAGGRISYSPDGTRFGYVGRQGQEWVAMVDGKEVLRKPIGTNQTLLRGAGLGISFSPNSRHWFLYYNNRSEGNPLADPPRLIWDGVVGPVGANNDIVVSGNGERYAYTVSNPANPNQKVLMVDGKPAPTLGFAPVFTGDGLHLYTQRITIPKVGPQVTELLLDGRPILRAFTAEVYAAPVGSMAVIKVRQNVPNRGEITFLHAGGVKVPGSETQHMGPVRFSDDGKHWSVLLGMPGEPNYMIVDGVKQREYATIDTARFTDTGKPVYVVGAGGKSFVITGDQESGNGYQGGLFPISLGKGGRVGYVASLNGATVAVVDGKVTPPPGRMWLSDLTFSPDGLHSAYAVTAPGGGPGTIMVDFKPQAASSTTPFGQIRSGDPVQYLWSPDSKYTTHYGYPGTQHTGQFGLFLGDKYVAHGTTPRIELPIFTPDAKHLFWLAMAPNNQDMQVFLDGKVVYEFDGQGRGPLKDKGNWEMGADGTLTFIVQTVEGFQRVRVTPSPDNGVEVMISRGKVVR